MAARRTYEASDVWGGAVVIVGLLLMLGMCGSLGSDDEDENPGVGVPAQVDRQDARDRQKRLDAVQRNQALRSLRQACRAEDGTPLAAARGSIQVIIRCEEDSFVALIGRGDDDDRHLWTRWWAIGKKPVVVARSAFRYRSARPVPDPVVTAPIVTSPSTPEPAPPQGPAGFPNRGNNGYTGPRCYAPGGVWWRPC